MFGIGSSEFLVIIVVAVLVLGPEHLPRVVRTFAKVMSEFRRVSTDFQRTMNLEANKEEWREQQQTAKKKRKKAAPPSPTVEKEHGDASARTETAGAPEKSGAGVPSGPSADGTAAACAPGNKPDNKSDNKEARA